jgi:AcrR family transcriptional regulator
VTARGDSTREQLLDAAERLYGERGVAGVSLREIRLAASQRNRSALQFHFGDRSGLLLALTQRHLPRVAVIQQALYDDAVASGRRDELRSLVEVLVRPHADYLRRGPSERAWVRIAAEQSARPDIAASDLIDHAPAIALEVGTTIFERLAATMPAKVAVARLRAVGQACLHLCADRARLEDAAGGARRPDLEFQAWVTNLADMATGALVAPIGHVRERHIT